MESSLLDAAHKKIRRADALTREGNFAEAAECHEKVADLLSEVYSQISTSLIEDRNLGGNKLIPRVPSIQTLMTLESLALQRDYHTRQSKVVRMKQAQFEEYRNTLETQQRNLLNKLMPRAAEKECANAVTEKSSVSESSKQAIFRTIEEQDSLLTLILLPEGPPFRHPKDTAIVVEELHTLNTHLKLLVENLLSLLETKEREVHTLNERIKITSSDTDGEVCVSGNHSKRLAPLPPLAPLEMPLFDFKSA